MKFWTRSKVFQTIQFVKTYREGERKGQIEEEKRGFHWGGSGTIANFPGLMEGHSACSQGDCPSSVKFRDRLYSLPQKDVSQLLAGSKIFFLKIHRVASFPLLQASEDRGGSPKVGLEAYAVSPGPGGGGHDADGEAFPWLSLPKPLLWASPSLHKTPAGVLQCPTGRVVVLGSGLWSQLAGFCSPSWHLAFPFWARMRMVALTPQGCCVRGSGSAHCLGNEPLWSLRTQEEHFSVVAEQDGRSLSL